MLKSGVRPAILALLSERYRSLSCSKPLTSGANCSTRSLKAENLPYDLQGRSIPEAVRIIREEEPTRLGSVDTSLRGDLDTIVGKALEKDRARRYQSAAELATDLRNYLEHRPIAARPPTTLYQLRMFTHRNKALVAGISALFLVLLAGVVVSTTLYVQAERARAAEENHRRLAEIEARKAHTVADFTQRMLSAVDPTVAGELDTTLVQMTLDNAAERIETELAGQPEIEAAIGAFAHREQKAPRPFRSGRRNSGSRNRGVRRPAGRRGASA